MEDSKNLAYQAEEEKNPFLIFVTNLLSSIKLPFPPKKIGAKSEPTVADPQAAEPLKLSTPAAKEDESKPSFLTLPKQNLEPIKLEGEIDIAGQTSNPLVLWQVYALGGVLVARWAWMRWNEKKGQKKPDNNPSSAHD